MQELPCVAVLSAVAAALLAQLVATGASPVLFLLACLLPLSTLLYVGASTQHMTDCASHVTII